MFDKEGLGGLMKQAQEMQEKMRKVQEDAASIEVTGAAGAGMVTVVMNGRHDVVRVAIDDSVLAEDKSMLEDLVAAAVNDAVRKVEVNQQDALKNLTGGIAMPEGFKMPF
jgi:DNA-binding YbaB/EbfC family protein